MEYLIVLFLALFIVLAIVGALSASKRRRQLSEWAASRGLRYSDRTDRGIDDKFPGFACLHQGSNRYAYNIIDGDWSGRPFLAFDYHYQTTSSDHDGKTTTHNHHFSAVILESAVPLKPLSIRPEGFFDKLAEFVGFDDIDFESAEFSRKFYVKSPDRKWAFDVIHQRTMEFLLSQPRFTIEMGGSHVIAQDGSTFGPAKFESAVAVIQGILDRLPNYLLEEQKRAARSTRP